MMTMTPGSGHWILRMVSFCQSEFGGCVLVGGSETPWLRPCDTRTKQSRTENRIMLPDAANALGVTPMFVYEMLSAYAEPTFKLKAAEFLSFSVKGIWPLSRPPFFVDHSWIFLKTTDRTSHVDIYRINKRHK
jgi:hypothetical protein